MEVTGDA
jgi:hypothetical protein